MGRRNKNKNKNKNLPKPNPFQIQRFPLLLSETVLPDDYPVHLDYVYIVDGIFRRCPLWDSIVSDWKRIDGLKEIRRCDLFGHPGARLGDGVNLPEMLSKDLEK